MKHVTIKDVAKELKLSISTISRAFNDKYDIHPLTKELILQTAKKMGYSPNPLAKRLSQQKTYLIGIVIPEFINSYFPTAIMGMQHIMVEHGYQVLIMSSQENAQLELENVKALVRNRVDGIIISLTKETKDVSYYRELLDQDIPIVQFNRVSQKLDTSKVVFDDYAWAFSATEHLIEQGYDKITYLAGPPSLILSQVRKKGFVDAMKKHGKKTSPEQIIETGIFIEDGRRVARKLIEENFSTDAFFCFNDPVAIGAMEVYRQNGVRIPEEVGFIGFTESSLAPLVYPSLSSVEQPAYQTGETAAQLLLQQIEAVHKIDPKTIVLNGKLNVRESSTLNLISPSQPKPNGASY